MREIYEKHLDDIGNGNTRKGRVSALNRFDGFIGDKDLEEVDKWDLKDWVNEMQGEDISDLSIRNYYYGISSFYQWLVDWGERYGVDLDEESNPFEAIELPDLGVDPNGPTRMKQATKSEEDYRALTVEQVQKLIKNVPVPTVRNQLIVRLLYQTGVRTGELVNIELGDIDRERREIAIDTLKSDDYRTVYYNESLDTLLSIYIDGGYRERSIYSDDSPYLFVTRQTDQISQNRIEDIVKEAAENAGIQGEAFRFHPGGTKEKCSYAEITPHVLRHTMAHHSIHEGEPVDLVTLRSVLGHQSLDTTRKYLDAGKERRRSIMQRKGPGFTSGDV